MTMETHLRALLLATPGVASIVAGRIDWGLRPQGDALPAIRLTNVFDGPLDHSLDGPGLSRARIQIDCFAASYAEAKALGHQVRSAFDGFRDDVLRGVLMAGARDLTDDSAPRIIFGISADFLVTYVYSA